MIEFDLWSTIRVHTAAMATLSRAVGMHVQITTSSRLRHFRKARLFKLFPDLINLGQRFFCHENNDVGYFLTSSRQL